MAGFIDSNRDSRVELIFGVLTILLADRHNTQLLNNMSDDWDVKICCMGAGYVGGPTMAVIAKMCPKVRRIGRFFDDAFMDLPPSMACVERSTDPT